MNNYKVYKHTSPSGKVYIGITRTSVKKRWLNGKGYQKQVLFYKAILKYGWDNIEHKILFRGLSEKRAKNLEVALIRHYKNLGISYNLTNGGEGANGLISSQRKIVYQYSLDGTFIKEWSSATEIEKELHINNSNIIACCMGRYKQAKGFIWSHNFCLKIPSYKRALAHPVRVLQYSSDGYLLNTFKSASEAARAVNGNDSNIIRCCKGRTVKAYGFIWKQQ